MQLSANPARRRTAVTNSAVREYVEANRERFLDELKELVAIPSISTLSEHQADLRHAAAWLAAHLREQIGMDTARVIETGGHPLVYGEWLQAPGKPTVLIYGHYDVQPVDPLELWKTPPFEPTVVGENLYGRGAVDDKGQMFATIKALEALKATGGFPCNIKLLIEGEEEAGGASIAQYVQDHPSELAADCALILDTGMVAKGVPTICYALRGLTYLEIEARGAGHDLHSGSYGGIAPNPIQALAWVLADLKSRDGTINIPGLYDTVRPLSEQERATLERQSKQLAPGLMQAAELHALPGEAGFSVLERATARPTLEVHGIRGGFVGQGAKTVIPAVATAKISLRLVANQKPDAVLELVRQRVAELAPEGIELIIHEHHGGEPVEVGLDAPVLQQAVAALEEEFGHPVEFERGGGTIPVAALFAAVLGQPVVMMGFGLADDNVHAPNEKFYIPNYYHAIRSVAGFLSRVGG
ncbi:MAG: dipeptidase [Roseiflexaceae bacterium]|nr:dipeptidase [Roseiflexaceae bacterium]